MSEEKTLGTKVTPEFYARVDRINDDRGDKNMSETVRFLLREGAYQVDLEPSFAQRAFKNLAIALALVALIGYLWASQVGYERPIYVGVVWMIPAVAFLWLHELWPAITAKLGRSSAESVSPSEA